MDQKQYTLSNKDKKFLSALVFLQTSIVVFSVSVFGFYYKGKTEDCRRLNKRLELAEWATSEVNKIKAEQKIESMKQSYKKQGIKATEY